MRAMIEIYCRGHHCQESLCPSCVNLLAYAEQKLEDCAHGERKPTCQKCAIHCYGDAQRERIRDVMCYAGPRMLLRHPWLALRHAFR